MLILRLTPNEFGVMVGFLRAITHDQKRIALRDRPLSMIVLQAYLDSLSGTKLYTWFTLRRSSLKEYQLKLPLPAGLALYREMQQVQISSAEQLLLARLDKVIVDYLEPGMAPQHISSFLPTTLVIPHG